MMMKTKQFGILHLIFLFLIVITTEITARELTALQKKWLSDAEKIWQDKTYLTWTDSELRGAISSINTLIENLKTIEHTDNSAAWKAVISIIPNLERRRTAYQYRLDKKKLPGESANIESCLTMLEQYIADSTRNLFTDSANKDRRYIEQRFLIRFADCLETIANDETAYIKAGKILRGTMLPSQKVLQVLKEKPEMLDKFLRDWKFLNDETLHSVTESIVHWIREDESNARRVLNAAVESGDVKTASQMLMAILIQVSKSSENVAVFKSFIEKFPFEDINEEFLETINAIVRRHNDRQWAIKILKTLSISDTTEYQHQKQAVTRLFETIAKKAEIKKHQSLKKRTVILIGQFFSSGSQSDMLPDEYYRVIPARFKSYFERRDEFIVIETAHSEILNIQDVIKASEENRRLTFSQVPELPRSLKDHPAIIITGAYIYNDSSKRIELFCRIADKSDGVILLSKDIKLRIDNVTQFRADILEFAQSIEKQLDNEVSSAFILDNVLKSPLEWKPDIMKAAIFHGLKFGVERYSTWDKVLLGSVSKIQVIEPFWGESSEVPNETELIHERLKSKLTTYYPGDILIRGTEEIAPPQSVTLAGNILGNSPLAFDIFIKYSEDPSDYYHRDEIAKLTFEFSRNSSQLSKLELERSVDVVLFNLQALIPSKYAFKEVQFAERISYWNMLPSFCYAGTSQFIVASRFQRNLQKKQRLWGSGFLILESVLLGAALYYDQQAIDSLNNSDLNTRNSLLTSAGITGVVSAFKAWYDIRRHNRRVKFE